MTVVEVLLLRMRPPPPLLQDAAHKEKVIAFADVKAELRTNVAVLVGGVEHEPVGFV